MRRPDFDAVYEQIHRGILNCGYMASTVYGKDRIRKPSEMSEDIAVAPFTENQCQSINAYQGSGVFHPFTCGHDSRHPVLVATNSGLRCSYKDFCDYTQDWVHAWMADWSWKQSPLYNLKQGENNA